MNWKLRLRRFGPVLALLGLFVAARAILLGADPPLTLLGGYNARELLVEPVAKASEARNFALFDEWTPNAVDNYQFWRLQAPAWVYPLAGFFSVFGVGYPQLRVFATLYGALGFVALLSFARARLRGASFLAAGVFLALDVTYALYSRSGILEPAFNTWVCLAMLFLLLAGRHWQWLLAAQWALLLGVLTKQGALYAAPAVVLGSAWVLRRIPAGTPQRRLVYALTAGHALLLAGAVIVYANTDSYQRAITWNFNHLFLNKQMLPDMRTSELSLAGVIDHVTNPRKWQLMALAFPITGPLALLGLGAVVVRSVRRRRIDPWHALVALWLVSALAAILVIKVSAMRYCTILAPPLALLAASSFRVVAGAVRRARTRFRSRRYLAVAVQALFLTVNGVAFAHVRRQPQRELEKATSALKATIGAKRAAIIGLWSAPIVFPTRYEHYYSKSGFNTSRESLDALHITHLLLLRRDYSRKVLNRAYPGLLRRLKPVRTLRIRGARLNLYHVPDGLAAHAKRRAR